MPENKGSVQNFFEDFQLGQVFECPAPRVLTEGDRVAYIALTGDRTPRFCDSHGLVHPLIVFHTVLGQTVRQISLNAQANLGYAEMLWKTPVCVGHEIKTSVRIIGLRENSNRKTGIVYVKTVATNQRDEIVLEYTRWVMVKKNREDVTAYLSAPVVPILADAVAPDLFMSYPPDPFNSKTTGGSFFFEDYAVGERILHIDGMTVNSSDHMSFARLYQNTARVHFDSILTGGKPLVYGGYPLSIGYAQAFNGLENRLGIVAINGGTHSNPVYAGDTLYSFTDVLDRREISARHGVLRLRLVVMKNHQPTELFLIETPDPSTGKKKYDSNVVLDLDYWELMSKQTKR
ncbi:MAG: MaoC family dehydratase [Ignavibacteriae bacterium]|nr:MaoC family dehydratase [Ignavibacteriota bacterium]